MHYIFRPDDWGKWATRSFNKVNKTIESCTTMIHLDSTRTMVNNFVYITALEEGVDVEDLEMITRMLWLKLEIQEQIIFKRAEDLLYNKI
jgi:hypothetical protein